MALASILRPFSYLHMEAVHRAASYNAVRTYRRWKWPYERELYNRRLKAGPIEETPRSKRLNWNEDVEFYAFANRISENISRISLRQAFTDGSYSLLMKQLAVESSLDIEHSGITDEFEEGNGYMANIGKLFAEQSIENYLRAQLPHLPSEGIQALQAFLTSTEKLSHIGKHIGISDLILYDGFPVPNGVIAKSFLALIGVIKEVQGQDRAGLFVRDFVIAQLIGEDIDNIYHINGAMSKLSQLLADTGHGEPVPRVLYQSGQETLVACHYVGIYSDENLIGKAPGESLDVAEDMAARDALMTIYGIQDHRLSLDFTNADKHNSEEMLDKQILL